MTHDTIADMLTRLRNSNLVRHEKVSVQKTKMNLSIAQILQEEGFIKGFSNLPAATTGSSYFFDLELKYVGKKQKHVFTSIERVSKPGCRRYTDSTAIPKVLGGMGVVVMSTSKGIMSGKNAKLQNLGGEILFFIY